MRAADRNAAFVLFVVIPQTIQKAVYRTSGTRKVAEDGQACKLSQRILSLMFGDDSARALHAYGRLTHCLSMLA